MAGKILKSSPIIISVLLFLSSVFAFILIVKSANGVWTGTICIRSDGRIEPEGAPIETSDNVTYILTSNILSPTDGIIVERDNVKIDGNGFTLEGSGAQSSRGFYLLNRINVTISGVTIKGFGCGIYFGNSSNCKVLRSIITANSGYGIAIDSSSHNSIVENYVTANEWDGVMLYFSLNNAISMNNITANLHGIILISSQNNNISRNKIESNSVGMGLSFSSTNRVVENKITANSKTGITLNSSSNNTITGNIISKNGEHGVRFDYSSINFILKNNVAANVGWGFILFSSSKNSIIGNDVSNNEYGIYLANSSHNSIYHNNFINNTKQAYSRDSKNIWDNDYSFGGNYWNDYDGVDLYSGYYQNETGCDGIGDKYYYIDADNIDRYPLMHPWSSKSIKVFTIVCGGTPYPVFIESNSLITHFVFNQSFSKISFKVTSYSSEAGFCEITITKSLMTGPWNYAFEGDFLNVEIFEDENATHSFVRLTYENASAFTVIIKASWVISEFTSTTAMLVLSSFIATTLCKIIKERKQTASSHPLSDKTFLLKAIIDKDIQNKANINKLLNSGITLIFSCGF